MNRQWNTCWSAPSCHNPVLMKTWKSSTPELDPAPSTGRESFSDSRRRRSVVVMYQSLLTNISHLAQRTHGQHGWHSTGCLQEWTCWSRDFPTNKKPVTVASGRPCNTYWSAPWWTLPALPMSWQRLTSSPSAVPGIGRARFDEHTTPGGRTRMMIMANRKATSKIVTELSSSTRYFCAIVWEYFAYFFPVGHHQHILYKLYCVYVRH